MPPKLPGEIRLRVRDLEAAARFYRDVVEVELGYSDPHPPENEPHYEQVWGDYTSDNQFFTLYAATDARPVTTGVLVSFHTEDLDDAHRRMVASGADVVTAPRDVPWGRNAEYADPDGNTVSLTQSA